MNASLIIILLLMIVMATMVDGLWDYGFRELSRWVRCGRRGLGSSRRTCGTPPCGGELNSRAESRRKYYCHGENVTYTCAPGYQVQGQASNGVKSAAIVCDKGGWSSLPTCERIVCGIPPNGTNTMPVVTNVSISFPDIYTYSCLDQFATVDPLVAQCQADGTWSINPPNCTAKFCPASALPTLANADFPSEDVPIGGSVSYTCIENYRLAPASSPSSTDTVQTVTCQSDLTFTSLPLICVHIFPESCHDFFARDDFFAGSTNRCRRVTLSPQGTNLVNSTFQVDCCKRANINVVTAILDSNDQTILRERITCNDTSSELMPTTVFDTSVSGICPESVKTISFATSEEQLLHVFETVGNCGQGLIVNCLAAATSMAPAVKVNGQGSAIIYGTRAFAIRGSDISLSNYAYTGGACDCAKTGTAINANNRCSGGCRCTRDGILGRSFDFDTINIPITRQLPAYVTGYMFTQHGGDLGVAPTGATSVFTVGRIECIQLF